MSRQTEYTLNYRRKNYDTLTIYLPRGEKSRLQTLAKTSGKSLNKYIADCLSGSKPRNKTENEFTIPERRTQYSYLAPTFANDDELRKQLPF